MKHQVLIAFHRPGDPEEAAKLLTRLEEVLWSYCDCEPVFKQIDETTTKDCSETLTQILLLPSRGGHWLELVEKGCKPKIPPPYLLASSITHRLLALSSKNPLLVALEARRAKPLQEKDLELLTTMIKIHGLNPLLVKLRKTTDPIPIPRTIDSIVPLAMLPGRHTYNAKRYAKKISITCLEPILDYALKDIASWITYLASNQPNQ